MNGCFCRITFLKATGLSADDLVLGIGEAMAEADRATRARQAALREATMREAADMAAMAEEQLQWDLAAEEQRQWEAQQQVLEGISLEPFMIKVVEDLFNDMNIERMGWTHFYNRSPFTNHMK